MAPIVSEILKITIDPAKFDLSSPEFAKLRDAASQGGAKEQYYGLCTDEPDKLLWVLSACFNTPMFIDSLTYIAVRLAREHKPRRIQGNS